MPSNPIKLREAIAELRTAIHAYRESPNNARHYIDEAAEKLLDALADPDVAPEVVLKQTSAPEELCPRSPARRAA